MPLRTAVCRHVSHRIVYSPDMPEMTWHAMGSKTQHTQVRAALTVLPSVLIRLRWLRNAGSRYSEAFQSSYSAASISPFSSCARFSAHSPIAVAALGA